MDREATMTHRRSSFRIWLAPVLLTFLFASAWIPAAQKLNNSEGTLKLYETNRLDYLRVCRHSKLFIEMIVKNDLIMEIPFPVEDAIVQITDSSGNRNSDFTNSMGRARIYWPTDKIGELTLTATASKKGHNDAAPRSFPVRVIECEWLLDVQFREEYEIVEDSTLVVGAQINWTGRLEGMPDRGEDETRMIGNVNIMGGGGSYRMYAYDQIQAPFHFTMVPEVAGPYNVVGGGTTDGRTVELELGSEPLEYPAVVNLKIDDYSDRNIQVHYLPPVATGGGNGMIFDLNRLTRFTFPVEGGSVSYESGYDMFYQNLPRKEYMITVRLRAFTEYDRMVLR
jgi:hypothetical protein